MDWPCRGAPDPLARLLLHLGLLFPTVSTVTGFLQPILWLMDKFGDTLESIPCVGSFLGHIADFIETLVGCLICLVSCSLGLACGLFAMAVAWLYYKCLSS